MATRRSRKQSVRKRAKTQQNTENRMMDSKIRKEVALIFICLFSFLLFFSNLGFCGFVGEILQQIQFVLFGSFSFLFPFLLLFILFFYMSSQDKDNASRRIVAMIACYLLTESFFSTVFWGKEIPMDWSALIAGGGAIGNAVLFFLSLLLGKLGALFVLFFLIVLSVVFITEKPIMSLFASYSVHTAEKAGRRAKEDIQRISTTAREVLKERRERKENQLASGVDFSATDFHLEDFKESEEHGFHFEDHTEEGKTLSFPEGSEAGDIVYEENDFIPNTADAYRKEIDPASVQIENLDEEWDLKERLLSRDSSTRVVETASGGRIESSDIRIEAPIPGKSAVGIEVPNKNSQVVYLGDILSSPEFQDNKMKLAFGVGKDIAGKVVVTDIAKMPHLLVAGATGAGKSVSINTLIMSILYKYSPEEVRMIMVDPKVVELQVYNGIPHLLIPVVTDPKKAASALNWAVAEMTNRYKSFARLSVRDLSGYNDKVKKMSVADREEEGLEVLPQIIIIIDELADLMMVSAQEVEDAIVRLTQLARACGMHLIIATQRPSVNVITGLIKANVPSRIAFAVSSGVDSRTIIDMNGAEKLLGKGDMLFFPQNLPKPIRVQGAFVSDEEVGRVTDFLKSQGEVEYNDSITSSIEQGSGEESVSSVGGDRDELFYEAAETVIETEKASIGYLQRKFRIGFNRAARIMDQLADAHVVGEEEGTKARRILMSIEELNDFLAQERK